MNMLHQSQFNVSQFTGCLDFFKQLLAIAALLAFLFPLVGQAGTPYGGNFDYDDCEWGDTSALLEAQGTSNEFFPPYPDYVGWTDGIFTTFALVDYAGLTVEEVFDSDGNDVGTGVDTKVRVLFFECELDDDDDKVKRIAVFHTRKALGFAQCLSDIINPLLPGVKSPDFNGAPTIFGNKAADVSVPAEAAVGRVRFLISWTQDEGDPIADLVNVVNNLSDFAPAKLVFNSKTFGRCTNNGNEAHLKVHQIAFTGSSNEAIYLKETVEARDIDGNLCPRFDGNPCPFVD